MAAYAAVRTLLFGFSSLPKTKKATLPVGKIAFLSAEREGLIQCFAFHPDMVGAATLSRAVSMALPLFEPSIGFSSLPKAKKQPPLDGKIASRSGEGGIRTLGTN
ncbi:hypothetical protein [Prosthecochloris sp.]|uniref:hypothetical protein n=1 Tax=Prosthecochloris sp. TaxID=290513 RepID=UPI00257EA959|nr:hypothetical protein [Prosthecochloris sp.]